MHAVILAAGDGGRLGALTEKTPKPLVQLDGRPIIDYTLDSLAAAGVTRATVVVGYRAEQVREALIARPNDQIALRFAHNPHFEHGASYSLAAAREHAGDDPFILVMADHLLSSSLLERLLTSPPGVTLVAADFAIPGPHTPAYIAESTKLAVDETGCIRAIGKELASWDALDTGAFLCTSAIWDAVDAAPVDCELSVIFSELARRRQLRAADVSGSFWYDIDTAADLRAAADMLPGPVHGL